MFVKKMEAHWVEQMQPLSQDVSVLAGTQVHVVGVGGLEGFAGEGAGERFFHQACLGSVVHVIRKEGDLWIEKSLGDAFELSLFVVAKAIHGRRIVRSVEQRILMSRKLVTRLVAFPIQINFTNSK
jgi:hypothetical protein